MRIGHYGVLEALSSKGPRSKVIQEFRFSLSLFANFYVLVPYF